MCMGAMFGGGRPLPPPPQIVQAPEPVQAEQKTASKENTGTQTAAQKAALAAQQTPTDPDAKPKDTLII